MPEHQNSRFWLFRDKFVIVEAVLNIIVQATAFPRVFFLHKGLKNQRAISYLKIMFFNQPSEQPLQKLLKSTLNEFTSLLPIRRSDSVGATHFYLTVI